MAQRNGKMWAVKAVEVNSSNIDEVGCYRLGPVGKDGFEGPSIKEQWEGRSDKNKDSMTGFYWGRMTEWIEYPNCPHCGRPMPDAPGKITYREED